MSHLACIVGVENLIIDCTATDELYAHLNYEECIDIVVNRIKPKRAILTHMNHTLDSVVLKGKITRRYICWV